MELKDNLTDHFRLTTFQTSALKRLGLHTISDLLFHFPIRYEQALHAKHINALVHGDNAVIYGTLSGIGMKKTFRTRIMKAEGYVTDETEKIKIQWFNQPYIAKMYQNGSLVRVAGKVTGKTSLYISNPDIRVVDAVPDDAYDSLFEKGAEGYAFYPLYPESKGITSKWIYHALEKIFGNGILQKMQDPIPKNILEKYHLPERTTALIWIHTPKKESDADVARKRFAFEEVFFIQLWKQQERHENEERRTLAIDVHNNDIQTFVKRFPYTLTKAQTRAIDAITKDLRNTFPMSRLLEGDVGSGKTAVAAATVYAVTMTKPYGDEKNGKFGNLQVAYMAPTEILAKQHFESFIEYFSHLPINIGLLTGSGCKKFPSKVNPSEATTISRAQLLKWVANGEIPILIGTHALIQKTVTFENLAYVIIDEQHRFGTEQRKKLVRKDGVSPHLLSMTATPIPRTLALTIYGDLDLTLLDEMPEGRKPIITDIVSPDTRSAMYEHVRRELDNGRQAYVICPRIDEPDPKKFQALNAKSVKEEAKRLKADVFQKYDIDILHSKMKTADKDDVMSRFAKGEIDILVATSVVEVGVNVPNATIIMIEGAERFGLAQLHQLRGRVLRSNHQAYCYVLPDIKSKTAFARLRALTTAKNGFELAEEDLKLRGAGELYGKKQWGLSDIGMEAIKNIKMVEAARTEAQRMIDADPELSKSFELKDIVAKKSHDLHFE